MKNKLVTHFYLKEAKKDSEERVPIYLRVTVNGERAEISINKRINSLQWDKVAERAIGRSEPARILNVYLGSVQTKTEKYFSSLDLRDERISVRQIVDELKGRGQHHMTLIQAYEAHIATIERLSGIDYAPSTIDKYHYSLKSLRDYIRMSLHKSDLLLSDLDHRFIEGYHSYLRTTRGLMHNSTVKNIKNSHPGDKCFNCQ